jgi:hypothetical protein
MKNIIDYFGGKISFVQEGKTYEEKDKSLFKNYHKVNYYLSGDERGWISFEKYEDELKLSFGYKSIFGQKTYGRSLNLSKKHTIELRDSLNKFIQTS